MPPSYSCLKALSASTIVDTVVSPTWISHEPQTCKCHLSTLAPGEPGTMLPTYKRPWYSTTDIPAVQCFSKDKAMLFPVEGGATSWDEEVQSTCRVCVILDKGEATAPAEVS